jgi:RNA polymerase primary sigma factor
MLGDLGERERDILIKRFGLESGVPRTLEDIGQEYGVTRERIRQIEAKALAKLAHPSRARALRTFMEA